MKKEKTVLIRGTIIHDYKKDGALSVRLHDGFGKALVVIHKTCALPDKKKPKA